MLSEQLYCGGGQRVKRITKLVPDHHVQLKETIPRVNDGSNFLLQVFQALHREVGRKELFPAFVETMDHAPNRLKL